MTSILEGSLARTIGAAASFLFLDATLERDVAGASLDPADPDPPTLQTFTCKAIEDMYAPGLVANGLVNSTDVKVLILASTLATEPKPLDRITIRGNLMTIVPENAGGMNAVSSDPARATWECRASI